MAKDLSCGNMVYAAGDCVTGPATVVEAVAAGHKAADSLMAALEGRKEEEKFFFNVSRGHWRSVLTASRDLNGIMESFFSTAVLRTANAWALHSSAPKE